MLWASSNVTSQLSGSIKQVGDSIPPWHDVHNSEDNHYWIRIQETKEIGSIVSETLLDLPLPINLPSESVAHNGGIAFNDLPDYGCVLTLQQLMSNHE